MLPLPDNFAIQPRDYQIEAVLAAYDFFRKNATGHPVIVMPTGTGKSIVIAALVASILYQWPRQRILVLTHVKELIEQNAEKLERAWPQAPIGIYSAGLRSKRANAPIVFAGIQSARNCPELFGYTDLVIIDEAHLISPNQSTGYRKFLQQLTSVNPFLRVIGLTATDYRLGQGRLTNAITDKEGNELPPLFTHNCIDLSTSACWHRFIAEGYLVPPIARRMETTLDVSNVGIHGGEFSLAQLQNAVDVEAINRSVVSEMIEQARDRRKWLIFASGVEHSEHLAELLRMCGVAAAAVHSKMEGDRRDEIIRDFKAGKLRAVTNNNILTTGFDEPEIDYIGMSRPTTSSGLWVQMLGRGTRPAPWVMKRNCLVGDFAGNTMRLGPVDDPVIPRAKGKGKGEAPVKICDHCGSYNHASARVCIFCGQAFEIANKLTHTAAGMALLKSDLPEVQNKVVQRATFAMHSSRKTGKQTIKVAYFCEDLELFYEWLQFEGTGYALHKAHNWWRARFDEDQHPIPLTNADALRTLHALGGGRLPHAIKVWTNKQYPEVMSHEFF